MLLPLLGIGLHKITSYPENHPLLGSAIEAVSSQLRVVLVNRPFLLLGVARNQLLVEGLATDPSNPVLRELAQRLHRHQLGAIKFVPGVTADELADMLRHLGGDSRAEPLGHRLDTVEDRWEHIRLFPPAYDRLELSETGGMRLGDQSATESAVARLWIGL
ncbi:MAG TPA: hypothetical protein VNH46_06460, partial [Gemmatimonadales bacterium]|nr:hypothetical protein [Gemmatimonadales bacterium]